jgi:hypothetical protein
LSVWSQQRYLEDLENYQPDPIEKFDEDLICFLRQCIKAGEMLVLGIDANTDTRSGSFPTKLYDLGLINIFSRKFGHNIPPTYALAVPFQLTVFIPHLPCLTVARVFLKFTVIIGFYG